MHTFIDKNGYYVEMSFEQGTFGKRPEHVLVICRDQNAWLLTKHRHRGVECPGGKKEPGETIEEAAKREVAEETGAVVSALYFIGEYCVYVPEKPFVKAVFFAHIKAIEKKKNYLETDGPYYETGDLSRVRFQEGYSFLMKDKMISYALNEVRRKGLI